MNPLEDFRERLLSTGAIGKEKRNEHGWNRCVSFVFCDASVNSCVPYVTIRKCPPGGHLQPTGRIEQRRSRHAVAILHRFDLTDERV